MEDVIFVAYITTKNGKRIYARNYGLKAFPLKIKDSKKEKPPEKSDDSSSEDKV